MEKGPTGPFFVVGLPAPTALPTFHNLRRLEEFTMKYRTTIRQTGANTTGIPVPPEVMEGLGGGKRPAVIVRIGDFSYRSSVASMGGESMISLSAERREASGLKGGDDVEVELTLDTTPREVEVPPDLQAALDAEPAAKAFFGSLAYSHKLRHVLSITEAKTDETRRRRIDKAVATLRAGRK